MRRGLLLVTLLAALAAGCGSTQDHAAAPAVATPVSSAVCSKVTYGGVGSPRFLVPHVGPYQGAFSDHGVQNAQSVKFVLRQHRWRAGDRSVGTQLCDEASADQDVDVPKCARLARAFARDPSVLAVVGPTTSACAHAMIPILNAAPGGPVALVGPGNTYLGLTRAGPGVAAGDPGSLYPTGIRSYVRLAPADDAQGAALVLAARDAGVRRPFFLHDGDAYGRGLVGAFGEVAQRLGLTPAGTAAWDGRAASYGGLAHRIRAARADGVLIAGYITSNGPRLVRDLRVGLGRATRLLATDGFNQPGTIVEGAGAHADGLMISIASGPVRTLAPAGRRWAAEFERATGTRPCCYATYTAQAMQIVLDAIARSDATRRGVLEQLQRTAVHDGLLGDFRFDRYGDTTQTRIAIYRIAAGREQYLSSVDVPAELLTRR